MIGTTIQHYNILEKIGHGGMGVVYKAYDTRLERTVALKFLPEDLATEGADRTRFLREARAASAINHPNVCTIYDLKEHDKNEQFIVMEYIEGKTLKKLAVDTIQLPVEIIVDYAMQICKALMATHARGILHRDIKSENIMVTPAGQIKVMDFGLALVKGSQRLTQSSSTVGTIAYMSPEQIEGRPVDARSDIFSFGVVLYELLTGRLPFAGETQAAVIYAILNNPPALMETWREVPPDLSALLYRTLQKPMEKRSSSFRDIYDELKQIRDSKLKAGTSSILSSSADIIVKKPLATIEGGKHKHKKQWITFLAVAAMVLISATIFVLAHNGKSTYLISNRSERQLTFIGEPICAAWSPDGRYVTYPTNKGIYISPSEGGASRLLEGPFELAVAWSWTPDSRAVLAHVGRNGVISVAKFGINGEAPQIIADSALFASSSPDGKKILYTSVEKQFEWCVLEMDIESGERRLIARPFREGASTYKGLISPNGKKISYIRWNGRGHELWVMNRDGSDDHRIKTEPIQVGGHYSWAPDSKSFVIAGKLGHAWYIWNVALNSKWHIRLTSGSEGGRHVTAAPDGKSFAFQKEHDMSRICIIDLESKEKRYPLDMDIGTQHPAFSPDGKELYFQTLVNGHWQIWRKNLQTSAPPQPVIAANMQSCFLPVTTPDEKVLYVRGSIAQENRHGMMDWSQTLGMSSFDGGQQLNIVRAGDRVERIAPTPYQNDYLLYSVNVPDALFDERVYVLPPAPEHEPLLIFTNSQKVVCSAFDWGEMNQVLIAHSDSMSAEYARTISAFDIRTLDHTTVCLLDSIRLDDGGGILGHIRAFALAPNRRILAMIINSDKPRLVLYDLSTKMAKKMMDFDEKASPTYLVWSHDNKYLAVEMTRYSTDIYISEPMKYVAIRN